MRLTRLKAQSFRNIEACDIAFEEGVNVLLGQNAQGKTNALECIYLFARGKSFRGAGDKELVKFGEKGFSSEIQFFDGKRTQTLAYRYYDGTRKRLRNGGEVEKVSDMLGHFRAVLFCPDHLQLTKGGPEERRNFLNIAISQLDKSYISHYASYKKILDNRNYLLKSAQKGQYFSAEELEIWTEQMAAESAKIATLRKSYIERLKRYAPFHMAKLSEDREQLSLSYESLVAGETEEELRQNYLAAFAQDRKKELAAGCSLFGVHRDDLYLAISGVDVRSFASQGQQRSVVLALKLAEGDVSSDICGEAPVYLFDDVLSELDEKRRRYILSSQDNRQMIVTSCEKELFHDARPIYVAGGIFHS